MLHVFLVFYTFTKLLLFMDGNFLTTVMSFCPIFDIQNMCSPPPFPHSLPFLPLNLVQLFQPPPSSLLGLKYPHQILI